MPQSPPATNVALNDYLYADRDRIAAYHTQLLGSGVPLQSKFSSTYSETAGEDVEASAFKLLSAKFRDGKTSTDGTERTFDQSWPMVLATIAELDERGLIHDGALGIPVGSIIRLHGALQVADLRIMHDLWEPMTKVVSKKTGSTTTSIGDFKALAQIAKHLPQPLVANVTTSDAPADQPWSAGPTSLHAWGVLSPQHIIGNPDAFAIMNGGLFGEFWIIAVLDVGADAGPPTDPLANFTPTNTFEMMLAMQQFIRQSFGRPNYANGVTPLLIYRPLRSRG
jgi:hypothetical protein